MKSIAKNTLGIAAATGAAILVTAAVAVPTAQAAGTAEVLTISVHVGDVDARTVGGATHIYYRLQRAAEDLCGEDVGTRRQLSLANRLRNCEQQVIEPAVGRIHAAPLTAIYMHHFPGRRGTVEVEQEAKS